MPSTCDRRPSPSEDVLFRPPSDQTLAASGENPVNGTKGKRRCWIPLKHCKPLPTLIKLLPELEAWKAPQRNACIGIGTWTTDGKVGEVFMAGGKLLFFICINCWRT